jgi:DNA-binding HxlR family transcriptional regulator
MLSILKSVGSREFVRFGELKKSLAGISSTMLSERLRELEREGSWQRRSTAACLQRWSTA